MLDISRDTELLLSEMLRWYPTLDLADKENKKKVVAELIEEIRKLEIQSARLKDFAELLDEVIKEEKDEINKALYVSVKETMNILMSGL